MAELHVCDGGGVPVREREVARRGGVAGTGDMRTYRNSTLGYFSCKSNSLQ